MAEIHPTARVDPAAELAPSVRIGPYAVIGPHVSLGAETVVEAHCILEGRTRLGRANRVGPHAVLGAPAQIRDASREVPGRLSVGDENWIREFATIHAGHHDQTRVGHRNMLMAYSHVAHDCRLGDGIELANGVQLAGHVEVGDHAGLGGLAAVHQFVRVGELAFVGAGAMVPQDVPPFSLVSGDRARCYGINAVGLRRHGFSGGQRRQLRRAYRLLYAAPTLREGLERVRREVEPSEPVQRLLSFCEATRRGICARAARGRRDG